MPSKILLVGEPMGLFIAKSEGRWTVWGNTPSLLPAQSSTSPWACAAWGTTWAT